jgi:isoquinoline 1-oxidoreductase beta subunit
MGHQSPLSSGLSRRAFLITTASFAGGMALGIAPADGQNISRTPWGMEPAAGASEISAWIVIGADDSVTVRVPMPEIGNGIMTQVAMTVAEELACDWGKIRAEFASPLRDIHENGVYSAPLGLIGFFSGRSTNEERTKTLLQAGASARERLKAAAAAVWKVAPGEITAKDSVLTHTASGRTLRYGEVAAKAAMIALNPEPAPKPSSEWTLLGKATPTKLNTPLIVNGAATYGIDVRAPGMVYAALRQSPVQGGKLKSYNAEAVRHMPGVLAVVVVDPAEPRGAPGPAPASTMGFEGSAAQAAVAVIAEHYWQARKALDALPVEWDDGDGAQWKTIEQLDKALVAALDGPVEKPFKLTGDVGVLSKPPADMKIVEATYQTPYSEHACMEPLNGTALVTANLNGEAGAVELWHPSQHPHQALLVASDEARVPADKVTYHQTYVGGAFGRRVYGNDVRMVVAVAKKFPGRPVQVIWSREETTRQGRYRPIIAARMKAGLDANGMPQAMLSKSASCKGFFNVGFADHPYAAKLIPNVRIDVHEMPLHLLVGPYRGPGYNSFAFVVDTFIDECAHAAGADPMEYRIKLLEGWPDKGWVQCLTELKQQSGWGKSLPKGMGQGVAIANWGNKDGKPETGTTVGVVATVEVSKSGLLKVHTLDVAFDTGRMMNRDAVLTEIQGGAIFGYNMAMNEGLTLKDGRIVEGNFDAYPMARTGDIPEIKVHLGGLSGHDRFSEVGEPPVGPVGPAIGNAIFAATGKRLRSTPFRKHDLSWA